MFKQIIQYISQHPQTLWLLIIVGIPVVRGFLKALGEQKRKSDALAARKRAEAEAMRTGRPMAPAATEPVAEVSARQRLEELAQRRRQAMTQAQAQIQTQAARVPARPPRLPATPPSAPRPSPGPVAVRQVRLPGGIVLEVPVEQSPRPETLALPRAQPARSSAGKKRTPEQRRKIAEERARRDEEAEAADNRRREGIKPAQPEPAAVAPPTTAHIARPARSLAAMFRPSNRAEWQRAVILNEVLSPPVGMRGSR